MNRTLLKLFGILLTNLLMCTELFGALLDNSEVAQSPKPSHKNIDYDRPSVRVEALWQDPAGSQGVNATVQAGDAISFVCLIWSRVTLIDKYGYQAALHSDEEDSQNSDIIQPRQSVFLFCPLSLAYCAQDCRRVETSWPIGCTRQFRGPYSSPTWSKRHTSRNERDGEAWNLQEVIYTMHLALATGSGLWSCLYGGHHSRTLTLRVRDRPALLSLTIDPPSPVVDGTSVNLTCTAAPSPNSPWYHFVWQRTGSQAPPVHSTLRLSDTVSVLSLLAARPTDEGVYSCRIVHESSDSETYSPGSQLIPTSRTVGSTIDGNKEDELELNDTEKDPALLMVNLEVYRAPEKLTFSTQPDGTLLVNTSVRLQCLIHGGKPQPTVRFYHLSDSKGRETLENMKLYNVTSTRPGDNQISVAELSWRVQEVDNGIKFGCIATSPVFQGIIVSPSVELVAIFPPGPPIITAMPPTAISENRTRTFTCRSSKGSNPPATVHWQLYTAVDFLTAGSSVLANKEGEENASDGHRIGVNQTADFVADSLVKALREIRDPDNHGVVVTSSVRLIGRAWFNGVRVSCQLVWTPPGNQGNNSTDGMGYQGDYLKPAYMTTEVLFSPLAVGLVASPRSGIQEAVGEQVLECSTASSYPPAEVTWLMRTKRSVRRPSVMPANWSDLDIWKSTEDFPDLYNEQEVISSPIQIELLPGLYGGKRVVSRLPLRNMSRTQDGTLFICQVGHVEWLKAARRVHQLVVLYPPVLSLQVRPVTWRQRLSSERTLLTCLAYGGRPSFGSRTLGAGSQAVYSPPKELDAFNSEDWLSGNANTSIWHFSWSFRPSYPWDGSEFEGLVTKHSSTLTLRNPGRKDVGNYTCSLLGPGGSSSVTKHVDFAFPPELVPPGITAFTAQVGFPALIELYVWSFPNPSINSSTSRLFTPPACSDSFQPATRPEVNPEHGYSWYKVSTVGKPPNHRVVSRLKVDSSIRGTLYNRTTGHPTHGLQLGYRRSGIWSDVILVALNPLEVGSPAQVISGRGNTSSRLPTLLYRLFIDSLTEEDYGDYLCEIDHFTGRKSILARLQPPISPAFALTNVHWRRENSTIVLKFDPKDLRIPTNKSSTNNAKALSTFGESEDIFAWILVRICGIPDWEGRDIYWECRGNPNDQSRREAVKSTHPFQFLSYGKTSRNRCFDHIIANPETGSTIIQLSKVSQQTKAKSHLHVEYTPTGQGGLMPVRSDDRNRSNQLSGYGLNSSSQLPHVALTHFAYQFRFYDRKGSLIHHSGWYYNTNELSMVLSHPCLSLKSAINALNEKHRDTDNFAVQNNHCDSLFAVNCARHENYYIPNSSLVDSPCPPAGVYAPKSQMKLIQSSETTGKQKTTHSPSLDIMANMVALIHTKDSSGSETSSCHGEVQHAGRPGAAWQLYPADLKEAKTACTETVSAAQTELFGLTNDCSAPNRAESLKNELQSNYSVAPSYSTRAQPSPKPLIRSYEHLTHVLAAPLNVGNQNYALESNNSTPLSHRHIMLVKGSVPQNLPTGQELRRVAVRPCTRQGCERLGCGMAWTNCQLYAHHRMIKNTNNMTIVNNMRAHHPIGLCSMDGQTSSRPVCATGIPVRRDHYLVGPVEFQYRSGSLSRKPRMEAVNEAQINKAGSTAEAGGAIHISSNGKRARRNDSLTMCGHGDQLYMKAPNCKRPLGIIGDILLGEVTPNVSVIQAVDTQSQRTAQPTSCEEKPQGDAKDIPECA